MAPASTTKLRRLADAVARACNRPFSFPCGPGDFRQRPESRPSNQPWPDLFGALRQNDGLDQPPLKAVFPPRRLLAVLVFSVSLAARASGSKTRAALQPKGPQ